MDAEPVVVARGTYVACLVACATLGGVGDIAIYRWAMGRDRWDLAAGMAFWCASLLMMGHLFRADSLPFGLVVVLLVVIHLLIDIAWDLIVLGGRLGPWQWLGTALALAALLLIYLGRRPE